MLAPSNNLNHHRPSVTLRRWALVMQGEPYAEEIGPLNNESTSQLRALTFN